MLFTGLLFFSFHCYSQQKYAIYLDADFSGTIASSQAIKQGIVTALAEVNNTIQGFEFELVLKNHRANSLRSKRNLEAYLQDQQALMVFSGLHSPPLLANKEFINENRILMLDPWAAAGPITRTKDENNWIFRLSIDDSNAGVFISQQAMEQGFKKPYLLLEDTGWGRSNQRTMTQALNALGKNKPEIAWFNWGVGINQAKVILRNIKDSGADVIFFVGNSPEGISFVKAMVDLPTEYRLPIRSHWGITGGNFIEKINVTQRKLIDLQVIQTNFSFLSPNLTAMAKKVESLAILTNDGLITGRPIQAQTGFVHGYDLTKLVLAAINQIKLSGDRAKDKELIKRALENLNTPVEGLLKTYIKPFSSYQKDKHNGHEALGIKDYAMGFFDQNNNIQLIENL